jgi:hypothetical protein
METREPETGPVELADGWTWEPLDPNRTYTFEEGAYYFGDFPLSGCYFSEDEEKREDPHNAHAAYGETFDDGLYTKKGVGSFLVGCTAYGDGCFQDSDGRTYAVDGGSICLMSASLFSENMKNSMNTPKFSTRYHSGHILNFPSEVKVQMTGREATDSKESGVFNIQYTCTELGPMGFTLHTNYEEDEEEDLYDSDESNEASGNENDFN